MEKNTLNNNKENFTISTTTDAMLRLLGDFQKLQERTIALYEERVGGDNVINATVAVHHAMEAAIMAHISNKMEKSAGKEI